MHSGTFDLEFLKTARISKVDKTDKICYGSFLALQITVLIIIAIAMVRGNPDRLYNPYDPDHQPCGSGDRISYPYIYFPAPEKETLYITVCVEECPTKSLAVGNINCYPNSIVKNCAVNFSPEDASLRFLIYESVAYSGNLCAPVINDYFEAVEPILKIQTLLILISDLKKSYILITSSGIVALAIGYLMIHLAKKFPVCSAFSYIIFSVTMCILISSIFFFKYEDLISDNQINNNDIFTTGDKIKNIISNNILNPIRYWQLGVVFTTLAFTILLSSCLNFSKIHKSCKLIHLSAKYMEQKPEVLLIPTIMFIMSYIYFIVCLSTVIHLYSCGSITNTAHALPFSNFTPDKGVHIFIVIILCGLVWTNLFLSSATDFIVSSSCSIWYFNIKQWKETPKNVTIQCMEELIQFHIGSVALAAIVTNLFRWVRDLLMAIQAYKKEGFLNQTLQNFFLYISENSFVFVFISGTDFWESSIRAQGIIWKDADSVKIERISQFGEVFQQAGIICICFITTGLGVLVLQTPYGEDLNSHIAPIICIMIFSYSVGKYTMGMIGAASDSILLLIQIDEQMNGGVAQSIPQQLEEIFYKKPEQQIKLFEFDEIIAQIPIYTPHDQTKIKFESFVEENVSTAQTQPQKNISPLKFPIVHKKAPPPLQIQEVYPNFQEPLPEIPQEPLPKEILDYQTSPQDSLQQHKFNQALSFISVQCGSHYQIQSEVSHYNESGNQQQLQQNMQSPPRNFQNPRYIQKASPYAEKMEHGYNIHNSLKRKYKHQRQVEKALHK